ncbi:MAG: diguanylate cyclase [Solirubrobacteraceae bacterium]|nr:diguanylate cyclase [Solirubrobacteraceae bacterium]
MHTQDLLFTFPLITSAWATRAGLAAARRQPARRTAWSAFAGACGIAMVASLMAVAAVVGAPQGGLIGLYIGLAASALVLIGTAIMARHALRAKGWAAMVDPVLLAGVGASLLIYELVVPGFEHGDLLLTTALVIDVTALVMAAAAAAGTAPVAVKGCLLGVVVTICLGDGVASAGAAGAQFLPGWATPLLWGIASGCFAWAAGSDLDLAGPPDDDAEPNRRAAYGQTMLPLGAIVGYPLIAGALAVAAGDRWLAPIAFFGPLFLVSTAIAFARQAVLLVEQRRAAVRERALTADALRRNRELEALTGLASTMTEVLDERPVMDRGLEALRVAARTSSSALHLAGENGLALVASTGAWEADRGWAHLPAQAPDAATLDRQGARHVARLPLLAHGRTLGLITLVRPESEGSFEPELTLLGLLADQLGVALQNARDYHEKLEAAIRDPLTRLYNRRYFYEAFSQEIARHERYGTGAALVLFDIDDFKAINDSLGHQCGDDVLEQVGRIVSQLTRPSDTFARIGGEEFGLLMPETGQLDALLVAERLRTAVSRHRVLADRPVTLSGGVAAMPQDGTTREELQRRADQALYWAKRNGKNICAVASEAIASETEAVQVGMLAHLHGVVAGIDAVQLHTRDHSENVASYAVAICQAMGLDDDRIVRVRRAAFLHDIGKVAVSDTILGKPSGLTDEEFEAIKVHPKVGETMLHHAGLHEEARWIGAHHERLDGQGYPHGLRAEEIPLEARIIFVADSFEAMTSDRPYRRGMPVPDAVAELQRCTGTQFDPQVVAALVGLVERGELAVLALRDPV